MLVAPKVDEPNFYEMAAQPVEVPRYTAEGMK
jgi:hypothetical protein